MPPVKTLKDNYGCGGKVSPAGVPTQTVANTVATRHTRKSSVQNRTGAHCSQQSHISQGIYRESFPRPFC